MDMDVVYMGQIILPKASNSLWAVRNALYWMSAHTQWSLNETSDDYLIQFHSSTPDVTYEFQRLLNDYTLREQISAQTDIVRQQIAQAVLSGIRDRISADSPI